VNDHIHIVAEATRVACASPLIFLKREHVMAMLREVVDDEASDRAKAT